MVTLTQIKSIISIPIFFGIWVIIALSILVSGLKKYQLYQKIENLPTSKVASAALGLVELAGNVGLAKKLESPISKAMCAYWKVLFEYYKSGKNGGWRKIWSVEVRERFYLKDETGKMLIDPAKAEIEIPCDKKYQGHLTDKGFFGLVSQDRIEEAVLRYIEENKDSVGKIIERHKNREIRVSEHYLQESDQLYVLGTAETDFPAGAEGNGLIVRKSQSDSVMYISDSKESNIVLKMKIISILQVVGGAIMLIAAVVISIILLTGTLKL